MTHSLQIQIQAPAKKIYEAVQDLEKWTVFLPHYRGNRYLFFGKNKRIAKMSCWRSIIPISWITLQEAEETTMKMTFTHLRAITRGMYVEWKFEPCSENETLVSIYHHLELQWPYIGEWIARRIIGEFFITWVAKRTLFHTKQQVEKTCRAE